MTQRELARWLKIVVIFAAVMLTVLCTIIVPAIGRDLAHDVPTMAHLFWPALAAFWLSAMPVYISLALGWCIANRIGQDNAFCLENASNLAQISRLALADSVFYGVGAVVLVIMGLLHPALLLMILFVLLLGIGMSVACAALSRLTEKAARLRMDDELTV